MKAKWKSQYKDLSFTHPRPLIPQVFILICGLWILSEMLLWNFNCILCELKNATYRQTCGYRILLYSFSKCLFPCMFYYFFGNISSFHLTYKAIFAIKLYFFNVFPVPRRIQKIRWDSSMNICSGNVYIYSIYEISMIPIVNFKDYSVNAYSA